jgi:transcriptional regulator with XRE-family HTH domain
MSYLRRRAGLTLQQVAEKAGVHKGTVCYWETGAKEPRLPLNQIIALMEAYRCSIYDLEECYKAARTRRRAKIAQKQGAEKISTVDEPEISAD